MNKLGLIQQLGVVVLSLGFATSGFAADDPQFKFRIGLKQVDPKSNNGVVFLGGPPTSVNVEDDISIAFTGVYMLDQNWGIELLAALPFEHTIYVGDGITASTKHLPPTLSGQYYFTNSSAFTPYVGVGLNYTKFFSEKINVPADLDLGASWGLALQAGVDWAITDSMFVNLEIRDIDISADIDLNGSQIGKAEIDPITIGVNVGWQF